MLKNLKRITILISALAILTIILGPSAPSPMRAAKAHPMLLELAKRSPDEMVSVIVQKTADADTVDVLVAGLGGHITRDLTIINAFSAALPASAAIELSRHPLVRWVSPDGVMEKTQTKSSNCDLKTNYFIETTGAVDAWKMGLTGAGVTVAVVDSGISNTNYLINKVNVRSFSPNSRTVNDVQGHGTHVAGIIGMSKSGNKPGFNGMAPGVKLLNLKVSSETGASNESDVVAAFQWILQNKDAHNIRVVNLSLNSSVEQSYQTGPLNAAVQILWFNGIVVVAAAGNTGMGFDSINSAPANDPFIITVGAANENCTASISDDVMADYSMAGTTIDGFSKPDILAPGSNIISILSPHSNWATMAPERVLYNGAYFRLSGTSMSTPIVSGAVALLLQDEPDLTPDQVKYRLLATANTISDSNSISYPYLNVFNAVNGTTTENANTGQEVSQLLSTGSEPVNSSVSWNSVSWNSVSWNSVSWNSVSWNSVSWNSVYWGD
jgi:serine protease AprX